MEETYCEVPLMVSSQFSDIADSIREANGILTPSSFEDGLELYFLLIQVLEQSNLYN